MQEVDVTDTYPVCHREARSNGATIVALTRLPRFARNDSFGKVSIHEVGIIRMANSGAAAWQRRGEQRRSNPAAARFAAATAGLPRFARDDGTVATTTRLPRFAHNEGVVAKATRLPRFARNDGEEHRKCPDDTQRRFAGGPDLGDDERAGNTASGPNMSNAREAER